MSTHGRGEAGRRRAARVAVTLLALSPVACAGTSRGHPSTAVGVPEVGRQEPVALVLPTADGRHIDLADYRGRAVLVLAFTTDNLACQAMVRDLERLARAHEGDLQVVGIAGDDVTDAQLRQMLLAYRDVLELRHVEFSPGTPEVRGGVSALGQIDVVPTLFFLNRAGVVVRRLEGLLPYAALAQLVAPALPPRD